MPLVGLKVSVLYTTLFRASNVFQTNENQKYNKETRKNNKSPKLFSPYLPRYIHREYETTPLSGILPNMSALSLSALVGEWGGGSPAHVSEGRKNADVL